MIRAGTVPRRPVLPPERDRAAPAAAGANGPTTSCRSRDHFLPAGKRLATAPSARCWRMPWPGNVRELRNTMQRAALARARRRDQRGRPRPAGAGARQRASADEPDRAAIERRSKRAGGVVAQAAAELGLSRQALYRRMERLGHQARLTRESARKRYGLAVDALRCAGRRRCSRCGVCTARGGRSRCCSLTLLDNGRGCGSRSPLLVAAAAALVPRAPRVRADAVAVPRAGRHGGQLSRRRFRLRPALAAARRAGGPGRRAQRASATRCASSAWRWCSASCCSTRWCRTRRWRCCWSIRIGRDRLRQPRRAPAARRGPQARRPCASTTLLDARPSRCAKRSNAAATACSPSATTTSEEIYHLARRSFRLNGRKHELLLLRQLTAELRRQEVQTWKKVIRVISHELNNSLAPIASLAHSGAELLRRGQLERLPQRAGHDRGARAPPRRLHPRLRALRQAAGAARSKPVDWKRFVARLRTQVAFAYDGAVPKPARALRCRAAGAGAAQPAEERARVGLAARATSRCALQAPAGLWRIEVLDRGTGMNEAVLANALLPFYSTKRTAPAWAWRWRARSPKRTAAASRC